MMRRFSTLAPIARRLEGKVAVITGGASGIGERTARLFVENGAKVIIADIQDDLGHSVCKDVGSNEAISYVHCDVTKESEVENAVNEAVSKHGKLDIMFSNAGLYPKPGTELILGCNYDDFKKAFDVNVFGGVLCAKHAARVMIPEKRGSIFFTSSNQSVIFGMGPHYYSASKSALVGLSKNLCVELGQHGIRVNCVSPWGLATPFTTQVLGMPREKVEELLGSAGNLKGAILDEDDVANAALYLASDESKYVSGLNLIIDGGFSTTNVALVEGVKKFLS